MYSLRTSRHLLQLVPQSALSKVSGRGSRPLAGKASPGTSSDSLRARGLHATWSYGPVGVAEQEGRLRSSVAHQCGNASRSRSRSPTSRCRDRLLQRAAHLESKIELHPHVHCVVPAGGLSPDRRRWIKPRYAFFLPVKALSRVFRGKFVAALKRAFQEDRLRFQGSLTPLAQPKTFAAWLRPLFRKDWVVYSKRPFGGPEY